MPGAGFLLNNEMGDFNAGPGLTNDQGLIGTEPNLAAPKKRMLSSMTPTIVAKDGQLVLVTGSPGGRTIINTVLHTVLYTIDFQMNVQEAVDAPRFHHQWLPDRVSYEKYGFSADTLKLLESRGHTLQAIGRQGMVEAIAFNPKTGMLEAGVDGRDTDGAAVGLMHLRPLRSPLVADRCGGYFSSDAIASISTFTSRGSRETCTVARAGNGAVNCCA